MNVLDIVITVYIKFICGYIADHYAKNDNSLTLKIYIYFTNHKKLLPSKEIILNTSHVNSAYTYACITMISIFRQEEWFKSLFMKLFIVWD